MLDTGKMTATAGEAVSSLYLRMYVSTGAANTITPPTVSIAGLQDDDIGTLPRVAASGDEVSIDLYDKPGTQLFQASGAITGGANFYRAASGKVSATAVGAPIGKAITPASGNGAIFEGLVYRRNPADPAKITDPGSGGAIPVTQSGVCNMTSTGAETRTLAIPTFDGQRIALVDDVHGGNIVVTVASAANQTGNNTLTFGAVDDACELLAVRKAGVLRWLIVANDGVALSTV